MKKNTTLFFLKPSPIIKFIKNASFFIAFLFLNFFSTPTLFAQLDECTNNNTKPDVSFSSPRDVCINAGIQTGITGGVPEGGTYSGQGVIDDGNGITYSFDPAVAGLGTSLIIYNYTTPPELAQLGNDLNGEFESDRFGASVALSSDASRVAIGAPFNDEGGVDAGQVFMYDWDFASLSWIPVGSPINGDDDGDRFGVAIALSANGNRIVIGATFNDDGGNNTGKVKIYDWNGTAWVQAGLDILGEAAGDLFGSSLSMSADGNRIAVGATSNDDGGSSAGHVRLYDWNGTAWVQTGADIDGEAVSDQSGFAVALSADGNIVAIGARLNDGGGNNSGHVRMYQWNSSAQQWQQLGNDINGEAADDLSGSSISISSNGNRVAIGAAENDGAGDRAGHVRIFDWNGSAWQQTGNDIDGTAAIDFFGVSVALSADGNRVAIGARLNDENGTNAGQVTFYDWDGLSWNLADLNINGNAQDDEFGTTIALSSSGNRVVIGAPLRDGGLVNSGQVRLFNLVTQCSDSASDTVEVLPLPVVTFTALDDLDLDARLQINQTGGFPIGGVYSGPGIIDDGNGTSYTFDPLVAGIGTSSITYTYTPKPIFVQTGFDPNVPPSPAIAGNYATLSANGNRFAIGNPFDSAGGNNAGKVKIYDWNGTGWAQLGNDLNGIEADERSGSSIALSSSGNRVAIGAIFNSDGGAFAGQVRVYDWNGTAWVQVGLSINGLERDVSGFSVSLSSDGNRIAVGSPGDTGVFEKGRTRVYDWNGTAWMQVGLDINGELDNDNSGRSVALSSDGNRIVIGTPGFSTSENRGTVRIYDWDGTSWVQVGLDIVGEAEFDFSGISVSISSNGNRIAIGAIGNEDGGSDSGQVRLYDWNGTSWAQAGPDIDGDPDNVLGLSVSLSSDGNRVAIGAPGLLSGSNSGRVRLYDWNGIFWEQVGFDIEADVPFNGFGTTVSLSADGSRVGTARHANNQVSVYNLLAVCTNSTTDDVEVFTPCSITNTVISNVTCDPTNENNTLVTVAFDVLRGSGNYKLIDIANPSTAFGTLTGAITGTGLVIEGSVPILGGTMINLQVVDAEDTLIITEVAFNGSFETGDFSGWIQSENQSGMNQAVGEFNSTEGTFAANINNQVTGALSSIKNNNLGIGVVKPGDEIIISFDMRGTTALGGVVFAELMTEIAGGGTSATELLGSSTILPNPDPNLWTTYTYNVTVGVDVSGGISLKLSTSTIPVPGSFANVFFDNISIIIEDKPVCEGDPVVLTFIDCDTCLDTATYNAMGWGAVMPTINNEVIINADYDTSVAGLGSFEACKVTVNAGATLTIAADDFISVYGDITVETGASLIVAHTGSVVQVDENAMTINNGAIAVAKTTPTLDDRNFVAMSSPVTAEARDRVYGNSRAVFSIIPSNFVPFTIDFVEFPEFEFAENFLDDNNDYLLPVTGSTATSAAGIGQLVFPQPEPNVGDGSYTLTYTQNPMNPGTLNSGTITVPINYNGPATTNNYNLLGNPYASAIDVTAFITANDAVNEVYYWDHITNPTSDLPGFGTSNFSMNDISIRNAMMGIAAVNGGIEPGQFMASGQGFGIKADQAEMTAGTPVVFTNSIRVTGNNDGFRNSDTTTEINKLWLNLTTTAFDEAISQTGIGFTPDATPDFDPSYDSARLGTFLSLFTTLETGEQLAIQGREAFDANMEIALGFSTTIEENVSYTINLNKLEGIQLEETPIFLIDHLLGTTTNLKETPYSFISERSIQSERFTMVFKEREVLGVDGDSFRESVINLYPNPSQGQVTLAYAGTATLENAVITDVNGKIIKRIDLSNFNQIQTIDLDALARGMYFMQITSQENTVIKKLILR